MSVLDTRSSPHRVGNRLSQRNRVLQPTSKVNKNIGSEALKIAQTQIDRVSEYLGDEICLTDTQARYAKQCQSVRTEEHTFAAVAAQEDARAPPSSPTVPNASRHGVIAGIPTNSSQRHVEHKPYRGPFRLYPGFVVDRHAPRSWTKVSYEKAFSGDYVGKYDCPEDKEFFERYPFQSIDDPKADARWRTELDAEAARVAAEEAESRATVYRSRVPHKLPPSASVGASFWPDDPKDAKYTFECAQLSYYDAFIKKKKCEL